MLLRVYMLFLLFIIMNNTKNWEVFSFLGFSYLECFLFENCPFGKFSCLSIFGNLPSWNFSFLEIFFLGNFLFGNVSSKKFFFLGLFGPKKLILTSETFVELPLSGNEFVSYQYFNKYLFYDWCYPPCFAFDILCIEELNSV